VLRLASQGGLFKHGHRADKLSCGLKKTGVPARFRFFAVSLKLEIASTVFP